MRSSRAPKRWISVMAGVVGLACAAPATAWADRGDGGSIPRLGRRVPAIGGDISELITTTCGNSPVIVLSIVVCEWEVPEAAFVADINALRASRGLRALRVRPELTRKARRWAATMAAAGKIWHSPIRAGITTNWQKLGENVGKGPSEPVLHAAFVASARHLADIVDPVSTGKPCVLLRPLA